MVWEQLLPHALFAHWTEGSSWFYHMCVCVCVCLYIYISIAWFFSNLLHFIVLNKENGTLLSLLWLGLFSSMILLFIYMHGLTWSVFCVFPGKMWRRDYFISSKDTMLCFLPIAMVLRRGSLSSPTILKALKLNSHFLVVSEAQIFQVSCILQKLKKSSSIVSLMRKRCLIFFLWSLSIFVSHSQSKSMCFQ
jgi:hypothetical protein